VECAQTHDGSLGEILHLVYRSRPVGLDKHSSLETISFADAETDLFENRSWGEQQLQRFGLAALDGEIYGQ
jgi:hypothetical protein